MFKPLSNLEQFFSGVDVCGGHSVHNRLEPMTREILSDPDKHHERILIVSPQLFRISTGGNDHQGLRESLRCAD